MDLPYIPIAEARGFTAQVVKKWFVLDTFFWAPPFYGPNLSQELPEKAVFTLSEKSCETAEHPVLRVKHFADKPCFYHMNKTKIKWKSRWDSNPRARLLTGPIGFQNRSLGPLGYCSINMYGKDDPYL